MRMKTEETNKLKGVHNYALEYNWLFTADILTYILEIALTTMDFKYFK